MRIHIGINGACGRMGQRLVALAREDSELALVAAIDAAAHPQQEEDAGTVAGIGPIGVPITSELALETRVDAIIDFSLPEGTMAVLDTCISRRIPLVVATTGHSAEQKRRIEEAAHDTAILMSPNMSLGVNVAFRLVQEAGKLLRDKDFDVEILERHHRFKKDSPSGTALHFAKIVQEAMGQTALRHGREGLVGERPKHEIGVHAIRAGDNVGDHTIVFSTLGETLELSIRAHSRDAYARGALAAAKFLAGRPPGRYSMSDVLGLEGK
ncbi:MAG TPA: 4-hydroxy-tetrahydrodipicolinate reductase [Gemmataceae bacterium]|nr:4-hydroxy-tetrahydrodipicolinate reductase [Gemmataceae bacterium]